MSNGLLSIFSDSKSNLPGKIVRIYVLLIAANVAAWLWALAAFHAYPVLLGTAFWPIPSDYATPSMPTTLPLSTT